MSDQKMRIDISDVRTTPVTVYHYYSPFKRCTYTVDADGNIIFQIVRPLDLVNYDLIRAKKVSSLRRVIIEMFETINEKEYKVRELGANFKSYVLDERPDAEGTIIREEILTFEITDII